MTAIHEEIDASAGMDTLYFMKTKDVFFGVNETDADRDWIAVYLEPGYAYEFRLNRVFTYISNHLNYRDDSGELIEVDGTGVYFGVGVAGTYYLEIFGTKAVLEANGMDEYRLAMTEWKRRDINGDNASNQLIGGTGEDAIRGFKGKDTLIGGDGNDWLQGGKGPDRIESGEGQDMLRGGLGKDVFVFRDVKDSTRTLHGHDFIYDFSPKQGDKINLKWIDAIKGTKKNDAFTFIGSGPFTNTKGELLYDKAKARVRADVDGDGIEDFTLALNGQIDIDAADFVL